MPQPNEWIPATDGPDCDLWFWFVTAEAAGIPMRLQQTEDPSFLVLSGARCRGTGSLARLLRTLDTLTDHGVLFVPEAGVYASIHAWMRPGNDPPLLNATTTAPPPIIDVDLPHGLWWWGGGENPLVASLRDRPRLWHCLARTATVRLVLEQAGLEDPLLQTTEFYKQHAMLVAAYAPVNSVAPSPGKERRRGCRSKRSHPR